MSTDSPTGWHWDFGDGATSTLQNPSHDFAPDSGTGGLKTYTITLKVTWPGGATAQEIKTQYITVTTQLLKPAVIDLVKEAENQLYTDGLPEDVSVSACENMLEPGSCVQTYGCDCNKPPGTLVSEGEKPGCSRVPSCKNPASQPALVFIDNGFANIGTVETPKWKPANFMHGCQIAYQCSGEDIIPSLVDCASPVLDCGATYADGLNPPPDGLGPVNDPTTPWSPSVWPKLR